MAGQRDVISCNDETNESEQKNCEENAPISEAVALPEQAGATQEAVIDPPLSSVSTSAEIDGNNSTNEEATVAEAALSSPTTPDISRTNSEPLRGAASAVNASDEAPAIKHTVAFTIVNETDTSTATTQDVDPSTDTTNTAATTITTTTNNSTADADAVTQNNPETVERHPRIVCSRAVSSGLLLAAFMSAYTAHLYATGIFLGVGAMALGLNTLKVNLRDTKTLVRGTAVAIPMTGVLAMYPGVATVVAHDLCTCLLYWMSGELFLA